MNVTGKDLLEQLREAQAWQSMDDEPFKQAERLLIYLENIEFEADLTAVFGSNQWKEWNFLFNGNVMSLNIKRNDVSLECNGLVLRGTLDQFVTNKTIEEILRNEDES